MVTDDIVTALRRMATADFREPPRIYVSPLQAADEIERLRRWQEWGLHVFICHIKGKTCWLCLSPEYQDDAIENGSAEIIKKETRENGGFVD